MQNGTHRIPYALYLRVWKYGENSREQLVKEGQEVGPSEYRQEMEGYIYCPECATPLSRAPKDTDIFTNSRTAHFRHRPAFKSVKCELRTPRGLGLSYSSEEELRRAVQNSELAIISDWQDSPPEYSPGEDGSDNEYGLTQIVDPDGEPTEVPLGRHTGEKFLLPSKISTVFAICRNFDKNLSRSFFFPDSQYATLLNDKLFDVALLTDELPTSSHLYFGKIRSVSSLSKRNKIILDSGEGARVKIYTWPKNDERKHINNKSIGRTLLFYGNLYQENDGVFACKLNLSGTYCLLPEKYEHLLPDL